MRRASILLSVAGLWFAGPALAEQAAAFLGSGTYATAEGCDKLKALAAGGDRNISTVPETLTAKGFDGWEHSCTFTSVAETAPGKSWKVVASCEEGESEWEDVQFVDKVDDKTFKVKGEEDKEAMVYAVCDAPAAKQGN